MKEEIRDLKTSKLERTIVGNIMPGVVVCVGLCFVADYAIKGAVKEIKYSIKDFYIKRFKYR